MQKNLLTAAALIAAVALLIFSVSYASHVFSRDILSAVTVNGFVTFLRQWVSVISTTCSKLHGFSSKFQHFHTIMAINSRKNAVTAIAPAKLECQRNTYPNY